MRTHHDGPGDLPTAPGSDPLGSAAGLRHALLRPVGLGDRLLQAVVDAVVLLLLLAVPWLLALVAAVATGAEPGLALAAALAASAAVVVGVVVVWPAHDGGRSAGMRWVGVRVVDRRGRPAGAGAMALRAALLPLDVVVGAPLVLLREDRRRLGDLLAGTQVVRDTLPVPRATGAGPVSAAAVRARRPGTARTLPAASR